MNTLKVSKVICLLLFFMIVSPIYASSEVTRVEGGSSIHMEIGSTTPSMRTVGNISKSNVFSAMQLLVKLNRQLNTTNATEGYPSKLDDIDRIINTEVISKKYDVYTQDLPLDNMIVSSIFTRLLPGGFPKVVPIIFKDKTGKSFIVEIKLETDGFISLASYGYEFNRNEDESDAQYEVRLRELKKKYYDELNGVEELYAVIAFLGLSAPQDTDIGFSKKTKRAMLLNAATVSKETFFQLEIETLEDKEACFISEPMTLNYSCDKKKITEMLNKIASLSDNDINMLVDRAYCEIADYGNINSGSERYKAQVKETLKENRNTILSFLMR